MVNIKLIGGFAVLGLLLSFLAGALGGVAFAVIVLRALLGALLFAALGFGVHTVVGRFLPELLRTSVVTPESRSGVDITLPEENPHSPAQEAGEAEGVEDVDKEIGDLSGENPQEDGIGRGEADEAEIPGDFDSVDTFPDVGGISGLDSLDGSRPSGQWEASGKGSVTVEGQKLDAGDVAEAVKTMMKKDKEG